MAIVHCFSELCPVVSIRSVDGRWDPDGEYIIDVALIEVEVRGGVDKALHMT